MRAAWGSEAPEPIILRDLDQAISIYEVFCQGEKATDHLMN